jgi:hypothetical protein
VGTRRDALQDRKPGFVFPRGDVTALARILRDVLPDRARLQRLRAAACRRMETWSPQQNLDAFVLAVERAVASRRER